jgi:hypothetical protein
VGGGILGLIECANHTVRTRKHEVVPCSVAAGSNTYSPLNSVSPDKPSACEKRPKKLPPGPTREGLLRKAREDERVAHMTEWITSPGLQPPK